jgi:hypothetical protein
MRTRFLFMCISVYVCVLAYAGWVMQQPQGTWTGMEHAMRMSPVFVGPALAYVIYQCMSVFYGFMMRRTDARILKCQEKSQKILHGLKDTMRFDRTQALLSKYDPEYMLREKEDRMNQVDDMRKSGTLSGTISSRKSSSSLSRRMTAVAASTVGGAGMRLSGALAQLWSVTADTLIADDPVLLNSLRVAESQAQALEAENVALRKKVEQYEQSFGILYSLDDDGDTTEPIPECEEKENEEENEDDHSNQKIKTEEEEKKKKKKKKKAG